MILAPGHFLTWHTYGTWLHGDDAGSVDRHTNAYDTPRLDPDPQRFTQARHLMVDPPLILSPIARTLVDAVMREHCRRRNWQLKALAVRSNHVHVVISDPEVRPEEVVRQLKSWGTRKLRSHRIIGPRQRAWAESASTIYLFEPGAVAEKVRYVLEMQDAPPEGHGRETWREKL